MTERDAVRAGYERLADAYAADRDPGPDERAVLEGFAGELRPGDRVLDAGCGSGDPVLGLLADRAAAVGMDFSAAQLALAREAVPGTPVVRGDLTALPFAADAFDAAVAAHTIIHVPLDEHRTVLDELARVLRPGGRLLVSEGADEWVGDNPDWLDTGVRMEWAVAGADATRAQLRTAGFEVEAEETTGDELGDGGWTFFVARRAAAGGQASTAG